MSFSFRSLFQRGAGSNEPEHGAQQYFAGAHPQGAAGTAIQSLSSMQASPPLQFPAGASPFQMGGNPLFKTAGNEPVAAPPINSSAGMSPFSIAGATPTNAPLTVGDVIHQLPPEVVRMGALPAEQPLSLPPALLENALRSGQAALPVFELYRVCPALFQVPISPQDPRLVALPASKLPGLIAQAREGNSGTSAPPAAAAALSPFSLGQPAAAAPSPFSLGQPAAAAPSPFSLGQPAAAASPFSLGQPVPTPHSPAGSPFQMAPPAAEPAASPPQAQAFPFSPFAAAAPGFAPPAPAAEPAAPASPFSLAQPAPQQAPVPAVGSPFSFGPNTGGSPFGASSQPPAGAAGSAPAASPFSLGGSSQGSPFGMSSQPAAEESPFSQAAAEQRSAATLPPQASISNLFTPQAQQRASTPSDMTTSPAMPFGSPFVSAMQEAAPQAEAPAQAAWAAQPATPPPAPAPAAAPGNAAASSGMVKLGFATVLSGYSVEELGFNPTTLPAWISTSVPASALQEQISSGNIVLELGMLIDGISDLGFRNTLSSAKRDFRIKLPQNEVFHSLTNASAAPAAAAPRPAAQAPTLNAQPMFTVAAAPGSAPAPQSGEPLNPFAQSQPAAFPAASLSQGSAPSSGGPMPFAFTPPAPLPALDSAPPMSSPSQLAFAPSAPVEPPKPQPSPVASSLFGTAQQNAAPSSPPSAPLQPIAGAFQHFGFQPAPAGGQPVSAPSGAAKPFDPFASSSTGPLSTKSPAESGFSSAQLLGQAPAPHQPATAFAPAPESKPAASLFAAPESKPAASLFAAPESRPTTSLFAKPAPAPFQPTPSFAPALEEIPSFSQPAAPAPQQQPPATRGLFSPQPVNTPLFSEPATPQIRPEPKPAPAPAAPAAAPAKMAAVKHSFLGLAPLDTQTDQLLLRALLGTEEKLTAPRVVELLALQHGLSACVCLHGSHVLSHADSSKPDAAEFQRQAPDIARQLRGLAPLIGIEGAETFTLNAGGRLLTFCFPGDSIVGVLHDAEPSIGMRDKITLIARELARMLG